MKQNKGTLRKVLHHIRHYIGLMLLSMLLAALTVAGTLYIPIIIGNAIDCIVGKGNVDFDRIVKLLINAGAVAGMTALLQWLMSVINNRIAYNVVRDIRNEAFEKIEVLPFR